MAQPLLPALPGVLPPVAVAPLPPPAFDVSLPPVPRGYHDIVAAAAAPRAAPPVGAADTAAGEVDLFFVGSSLVGGVALLSYSMAMMSASLRAAFGASLKEAIRTACATRGSAFLTGALSTAALTSSTATSLLVLQFVAAGDMTVEQSLGVLLGINVGSTLNAHLMAFHVQRYGMTLVAAGYLAAAALRSPRARNVGTAVLGLGLLFVSISAMGAGIAPLKDYKPFLAVLAHMHNPVTAIAAAAVAAVALQSSNAVIAIAILLAQQGFLALDVAVWLVYGANVGTCFTSVALAIGTTADALRVALAYLAFKAVGVAMALPLTPLLLATLDTITAAAQLHAEEAALARAVADGSLTANGIGALETIREHARRALLPTQIATAHTLVNAFIAALFMPALPWIAAALAAAARRQRGGAGGSAGTSATHPTTTTSGMKSVEAVGSGASAAVRTAAASHTVYHGSLDDADHPFMR